MRIVNNEQHNMKKHNMNVKHHYIPEDYLVALHKYRGSINIAEA